MCPHDYTEFRRFTCSNGSIQVREICTACGANVRGVNHVPHAEAVARTGLPVAELPPLREEETTPLFD